MPKILENPKEIILSCARDIILQEGYSRLNMRTISKRSGIAVGTIYNYFPDKRDITIQLLENFWLGYLNSLEKIAEEPCDIYVKLKKCCQELENFVKTFRDVWLKNYTDGYTEDTILRKKNVTEKFNNKLKDMLINAEKKEKINLFMSPDILAKFIIQNFIMMCQMNDFNYEDFETIIKKLLQ